MPSQFDGLAAGAQGLQQYVRATKEQAVEDEVKALEQADKGRQQSTLFSHDILAW